MKKLKIKGKTFFAENKHKLMRWLKKRTIKIAEMKTAQHSVIEDYSLQD